MSDKLTVVEQKEVTFYEDELTAVRADDGQIFVSLPSLCEALGIQTSAQTKRINTSRLCWLMAIRSCM